jgi:light-regulated signal transduction histidine kinase (bacteriophytochrome)
VSVTTSIRSRFTRWMANISVSRLLRATITRPLLRLGSEARRVGAGEFATPLQVAAGPREIAAVGIEIESMRERIVTELAKVEAARAQVERQARELSRSNAELEQFAYVASHDLQEPLRKIASFCEALQRRYGGRLDARADQYIEFAVDGARRMQALIDDLLTFSRVGSGKQAKELLPLREALDAATSALAGSIEQSGAEVSAGELPRVEGDRALLGSLFQNLISNAVKFRGASPPRVRIEARRRGKEWEVSCADNGIGVDAEQSERIFLIFQRLHPRQAYEGSGIGLSLARKIVEHHGGRIWLDASYEGGACFRFTLPVVEGAMAADAGRGEGAPVRQAGAGRALGPQARMGDLARM